MWNEFNIKTFPAETIVYRDGLYCPELSTIDNENVNKKYDLPVHIIYVGELKDKNLLCKYCMLSLTCDKQCDKEDIKSYIDFEKAYLMGDI